jgi:hypothetical protein
MPASWHWMVLARYATPLAEPLVLSFERFCGCLTAGFDPLFAYPKRLVFADAEVYTKCVTYAQNQGWTEVPFPGMRPTEPYTAAERTLLAEWTGEKSIFHQVVTSLIEWQEYLAAWRASFYCDGCSSHEQPTLLYHCLDCWRADERGNCCEAYELCRTCYRQRVRHSRESPGTHWEVHRHHHFARGDSRRFLQHVRQLRLALYSLRV